MSGKYLLDTNIIIALFNQDERIIDQLVSPLELFLPYCAVGELFYGAHNSGRREANWEIIKQFTAQNVVLGANGMTAQHYAKIKSQLKKAGRPIPENDIWIAALAQQYQLRLVSRDAHFGYVEGVDWVVW